MKSHHSTLTSFYWEFIKPERKSFLLLMLMPIIWCSAETYAPYLVRVCLDKMVLFSSESGSFLIYYTFSYVFLMICVEGSLRLGGYIFIETIPKLKEKIRKVATEIIESHPYSFFQSHQSGSIVSSLKSLVDCFEQLQFSFFYGLYPITITFFVSLVLIESVSRSFASLFLFWYVGMNAITLFFLKPTLQTSHDYAHAESRQMGFIGDLFKNTLIIKTFCSQSLDQNLFENFQKETLQKAKDAEWVTFKADSLRGVISFVLLSLMFVFLSVGWKRGLISLGDFAFITATCFYVRRSTWMAAVQFLTFVKNLGIAKQSFNLLIAMSQNRQHDSEKLREPLPGIISFESVGFGYEQDKRIYHDFNLHIAAGEKVGIMGPSGVGKTTLVHLLLGLLDPDKGKILIGNIDSKNLGQKFLKEQITYVPQNATLFHRSIFENIHYGNPDASYEEVLSASKACLCHSFVSHFELGYETIIGEDGLKLSGGQRQRIALARAYLKKSPIVILDEATSALDSLAEEKVLDAFLKQNRTTLLISHRSSALKKLDHIFVLQEGKIERQGTFQEIFQTSIDKEPGL
jgi:ATP-binding cassette subfamily B protein